MTQVSYLTTENGTSVLMNGDYHVVSTDHPNYSKILEALKNKTFDILLSLIDVKQAVLNWIQNVPDLSLDGGVLVLDGTPFGEAVSDKVFKMIESGNDAGPLVNFLRKVRKNPSSTAQKELLLFCVANGFMIHENGNIVAYKSVRDDYTDIHSGKIYNGVGAAVAMNRGQVDDNREQTCSHGLHFAAFDYASTWAGSRARHLMIMSVNPEHVVSIPSDYNNQKGRCCQYEVVGEVKNWKPLPMKEVYSSTDFDDNYNPLDDEDETFCRSCGYDPEGYDYCPNCGQSQF